MELLNTDKIREVRTQSLSSVVCAQLEEMILNGRIRPGERINESRLSTHLGISRAPVREACRQLERLGMVEIRVNRGAFVSEINTSEIRELYDIRAALDSLAGEKAAENATSKDLGELNRCLQEMKKAVDAADVRQHYLVNLEFHMNIMRLAGNQNLLALIEGVYKRASLFRKTSLSLPGRLATSYRQHKDIVRAIKSKDPERTSQLMKNHIMDAKAALLGSLENSGA